MGKSLVRREDATLLHYAVMNNCVKTAKLLIQEGAGKYGCIIASYVYVQNIQLHAVELCSFLGAPAN